MSKYQDLKAKLDSNHAVCESIKSELEKLTPDEVWVCIFQKERNISPSAFFDEKEARNHCTSIVEKVVHYVLPAEIEQMKEPKPTETN